MIFIKFLCQPNKEKSPNVVFFKFEYIIRQVANSSRTLQLAHLKQFKSNTCALSCLAT
jgi:hypothetical protein